MQGIYRLTSITNNKDYIGMSKDIDNRFADHIKISKRINSEKLYIEEGIAELGKDDFVFTVLEEVGDSTRLSERKAYWINKFNSDITGYNRMKYIKAEDFVMPFGKHRDVLFSDVPLSYFRWLSTQNWLNDKPKLKKRVELFF